MDLRGIGPSLYDWERERWERQADAAEALERRAEQAKEELAGIRQPRHADRAYIDTAMNEALSAIADSSDSEPFNRWLWQVWACRSRKDGNKGLEAMALENAMKVLDSAILAVMRQEAEAEAPLHRGLGN